MRFAMAGLLGLIVPGAGHLYLGRRRAAAIFAAPVVVLAVVALAILVTEGPMGFLVVAVTPGVLPALAALNLALWAWRFAAGIDAARRTPFSGVGLAAFALGLVLLGVVPHAFAGRVLWSADDFLASLFVDEPTPTDPLPSSGPTPTPTVEPTPPSTARSDRPRRAGGYFGVDRELPPLPPPPPKGPYSTDGGSGTLPPLGAKVPWDRPGAIPWGDDGRFDLLLMGADAGSGRWSRRVDSLVLVEIDVATGRVAMIGIPRNLQNAPYPPGPARDAVACGCQTGLINEMYVEATDRHPDRWPGTGSIKGIGAIRSVASELTGRPIDAVLIVDMMGVIRVVDALGGVDITIPSAVTDTHYPDPIYGTVYQHFDAGFQHLDGREALAYARTRHADSDYARMGRQQTLLLAIRDQLSPATILDAPSLFEAAKGAAWTDLPRSSLPSLVDLFGRAADASVKRLSLVPPTYSSWLNEARIARIQADIAKILGPLPNPTPSPTPVPSPTPDPSPSPEPSDTATPEPSATATPEPTPTDTPGPSESPPPPSESPPGPSPGPSSSP